jgi:hypothetical protein
MPSYNFSYTFVWVSEWPLTLSERRTRTESVWEESSESECGAYNEELKHFADELHKLYSSSKGMRWTGLVTRMVEEGIGYRTFELF